MTVDTILILLPVALASIAIMSLAWLLNNWMRMRHGYPLESGSGQSLYPVAATETLAEVRQLVDDNGHLRHELAALKGRVATVESIVTDEGQAVTREIEALRGVRHAA